MFDVTSLRTYRNGPCWYGDVKRDCRDEIPMVVCGFNAGNRRRQVKPKQITFPAKRNLQYYEISPTGAYYCEKPFLYLAQELFKGNGELKGKLGDDELKLIEPQEFLYGFVSAVFVSGHQRNLTDWELFALSILGDEGHSNYRRAHLFVATRSGHPLDILEALAEKIFPCNERDWLFREWWHRGSDRDISRREWLLSCPETTWNAW